MCQPPLLALLLFAAVLGQPALASLDAQQQQNASLPYNQAERLRFISPVATSDVFRQSLHSPALLLFAIECLLLGLYLLSCGKRYWRLTSSFGLGLACEMAAWAVMVNVLRGGVFSASTATETSLIEWAVVTAAGSIGALVGDVLWRTGVVALVLDAGCSLALGIILMGDNEHKPIVRWVLLAVLPVLGLSLIWFEATFGMALASGLTGGFLLSLGVDLLVNPNTGMSLGLRYLIDKNDADVFMLSSYAPPTTTRIIIAVGWALALIAAAVQSYFYREPFIRRPARHTKRNSKEPIASPQPVEFNPPQHYHSSSDAPQLEAIANTHGTLDRNGESPSQESEYSEEPSMQQYYATTHARLPPTSTTATSHNDTGPVPSPHTLTGASLYAVESLADGMHPSREFSSPEAPPTRPGSIVSTDFAMGLRSRPPTFMDLPLNTHPTGGSDTGAVASPLPADQLNRPGPFSVMSDPTTWVSGPVPVIATGSAARAADADALESALEDCAAHYPPSKVDEESETNLAGIGAGNATAAYLARGLSTGRQISLAPTATTPSTGETSDVLKSTFGQLPGILIPGGPGTPKRSSTMHGPPTSPDQLSPRPTTLQRGVSAPSRAPEVDFFTAADADKRMSAGSKRFSEMFGRGGTVHTPPLTHFFEPGPSAVRPNTVHASTFGSPDVPTDPSIAPSSPILERAGGGGQGGYFTQEPIEENSAGERRVTSDESGATMSSAEHSGEPVSTDSEDVLSGRQRVGSASTTTFGLPTIPPKSPKRRSVRLSQGEEALMSEHPPMPKSEAE